MRPSRASSGQVVAGFWDCVYTRCPSGPAPAACTTCRAPEAAAKVEVHPLAQAEGEASHLRAGTAIQLFPRSSKRDTTEHLVLLQRSGQAAQVQQQIEAAAKVGVAIDLAAGRWRVD